MTKGYSQISLPDALYEKVRKYVEQHPEFVSVSDFVKYIVRKELDRASEYGGPKHLKKDEE